MYARDPRVYVRTWSPALPALLRSRSCVCARLRYAHAYVCATHATPARYAPMRPQARMMIAFRLLPTCARRRVRCRFAFSMLSRKTPSMPFRLVFLAAVECFFVPCCLPRAHYARTVGPVVFSRIADCFFEKPLDIPSGMAL